MDDQLSGLLVGATLHTRPPEIYRALVEATAFGTRRILDAYAEDGIGVRSLMACGGMPENNPWVMQVFSDVCDRSIDVVGTSQAMALGAAMCGAAAAGKGEGGYESVREAGKKMSKPPRTTYKPVPEAAKTYDRLYEEYCRLYDRFGRQDELMHRLRDIRKDAT
jgi:L-ribulokinase